MAAELFDLPNTPAELEDFVAALFQASGHFVEKNIHAEELELTSWAYSTSGLIGRSSVVTVNVDNSNTYGAQYKGSVREDDDGPKAAEEGDQGPRTRRGRSGPELAHKHRGASRCFDASCMGPRP